MRRWKNQNHSLFFVSDTMSISSQLVCRGCHTVLACPALEDILDMCFPLFPSLRPNSKLTHSCLRRSEGGGAGLEPY